MSFDLERSMQFLKKQLEEDDSIERSETDDESDDDVMFISVSDTPVERKEPILVLVLQHKIKHGFYPTCHVWKEGDKLLMRFADEELKQRIFIIHDDDKEFFLRNCRLEE